MRASARGVDVVHSNRGKVLLGSLGRVKGIVKLPVGEKSSV